MVSPMNEWQNFDTLITIESLPTFTFEGKKRGVDGGEVESGAIGRVVVEQGREKRGSGEGKSLYNALSGKFRGGKEEERSRKRLRGAVRKKKRPSPLRGRAGFREKRKRKIFYRGEAQ